MRRHLRGPLAVALAAVIALTAAPAVAKPATPESAPTGAEVTARPSNDHFGNARAIARPGRFEGTTVGATRQQGEPLHAAGNPGGHSVWWKWTPAYTRDVIITTRDSNFDTLLGVYRGRSLDGLRRIASNDDVPGRLTSRVDIRVFAGVRYKIAVDGYRYPDQTAQTASAGHVVLRVVNA